MKIIDIIELAKERAYRKVNEELILMYWEIGEYISKQSRTAAYGEEKVSPLVTQLSWTNHLKIMSACKTMEERIFYMNMCIKERYSVRELARQIDSGYYEKSISNWRK